MRPRTSTALLPLLGMLALAFSFASPSARATDLTLAVTDTGAVRGAVDGDVVAFKGIPYAAPPVGPLRWRAPQPVTPWTGERPAAEFSPACPQSTPIPQSEDCLTLNVWRPLAADATPRPVMVWIYGGALVAGMASATPGAALARQDVVVVTLNYRLGRLGFFAYPALWQEAEHEPKGNYGFLDQEAALHWVRRNIAAFGGDPRNVTLFGESAGGGSVLTHLVSPRSHGLFVRAILQSPAMPSPRANITSLSEPAAAKADALAYAKGLGVAADGAEGLAALRALPAARLLSSTQDELNALVRGTTMPGFPGPLRDGMVLTEAPETALRTGRWNKVPVITGATNRDIGVGQAKTKAELFAYFGPLAAEARRVYDPTGQESLDELIQQAFADRTMVEPTRHLADAVRRAGQPSFLYRFSYVAESERAQVKGATHGRDVAYAFDMPELNVPPGKLAPADVEMARRMSAAWVAFARTGSPNGPGLTHWPVHEAGHDIILNFTDAGIVVEPDPLKARIDLWEKVQ